MKYLIPFFALIFCWEAFSDMVVSIPTWADPILGFIATPAAAGILIPIIELVMRMFPTAKAWSLLVPVQYASVGIGKILIWLGQDILTPVIQAGNNVTPPAVPPAAQGS
jgi:hypothetical protein